MSAGVQEIAAEQARLPHMAHVDLAEAELAAHRAVAGIDEGARVIADAPRVIERGGAEGQIVAAAGGARRGGTVSQRRQGHDGQPQALVLPGARRVAAQLEVASEGLELRAEGAGIVLWGNSLKALEASEKLFELAGSAATRAAHNLDRHWRNARTHTLHDPVRWKLHLLGNYHLNGALPARHSWN